VKRKTATAAELEACKSEFLKASAAFTLERAARAVLAGEPLPKRDREFIALRLKALHIEERERMRQMRIEEPIRFRAYMADYLQSTLRITLEQAAAAVAGAYKADSIRKAVDRLRAERLKKGRNRR
jgi:hypothetical protein